jgi:hypothetical protein
LGRRDSTTANFNAANSDLPAPSFDLPALINAFKKKGFSADEMVVLFCQVNTHCKVSKSYIFLLSDY